MIARKLLIEDGAMLRAKAQVYAATMYPEYVPDIEKIHWLIRSVTNDPETHYSRVVGKPGEPQAAIITKTENNVWAMKKSAPILLWYSELPGAGAFLLRGFRDWLKTQPYIVAAGFSADWLAFDDRPLKLAERIGFQKRGEGNYMFFPRGSKAK